MTEFQKQFNEVAELLKFNDFNQTIKRIIDFTLDTENIVFYKKTIDFLNWLDDNTNDDDAKKNKLQQLLNELYNELDKRTCHEHQTIIKVENLVKNYSSSFQLGPNKS